MTIEAVLAKLEDDIRLREFYSSVLVKKHRKQIHLMI